MGMISKHFKIGKMKYRSLASYRALDGTIFKDVDTQGPATLVLFNDLSALRAYNDLHCESPKFLLQLEYQKIVFHDTSSAAATAPTQFLVYLSPVKNHGRWQVRCGNIDYVEQQVVQPAAKAAKPKPATAPSVVNLAALADNILHAAAQPKASSATSSSSAASTTVPDQPDGKDT